MSAQTAPEPNLAERATEAGVFLGTLFPPTLSGYVERRWWRGQYIAQRWDPCGARTPWLRVLPALDHAHVFVGIAARRREGDGGRANCYAMPALFVDADLRSRETAAVFVGRLEEFPLQPTLVVRSGTGWGLHVYWCLREPHLLMNSSGAIDVGAEQAWQRAQLGLAQHFDTDPTVCDLPRIMRLPGTRNIKPKNGPGVVVRLLRTRRENRYNLADFDSWRADVSKLPRAARPAELGTWSDPENPDAVDFLVEFGRRGWLLSDQGGGMHYVRCPWAEQHSEGGTESGTAIWLPDEPGWSAGFRCLHAHCSERRTREVYAYFRLERERESPLFTEERRA